MINPRPWYRWHASSLAVSCLFLTGFALIAIPGNSSSFVRFGWPYVHYVVGVSSFNMRTDSLQEGTDEWVQRATLNGSRHLVPVTYSDSFDKRGYWSNPKNWTYQRPECPGRWIWWGLVANTAIAASSSMVAGGTFEFRRRHRSTLWQLRLSDLLAVPFALSLAFGLLQIGASRQLRDEHRLKLLEADFPRAVACERFTVGQRVCPIWLARLCDGRIEDLDAFLGTRSLPTFTRVFGRPIPVKDLAIYGSPKLGEPPTSFDPPTLARRVNELEALECLTLVSCDRDQLRLLEHLDPSRIKSLQILVIDDGKPLAVLRALNRFEHLRRLELDDVNLDDLDFPGSELQQLEELVVNADKVGERGLTWMSTLPRLRVVNLKSSYRFNNFAHIQSRLPHAYVSLDLQSLGGVSAF